ncbi:30S ribosomal protein S1 [Candidatus Annandia adelgestsuga]|uniref:Small ribosomal subunit protein bS1 n=1 Tax=Candidatus Annandia adelgestsuga TaxID=1302411 RepID=A0A3Q9CKM2_9ENTR|nr:30S ribosomal protein S1 [Candidatus Annandia adelgestsuga]AZP36166.1 30S ribosomal protein S1 [Candidatus Annandia adelgestsuga]
MNNFFDTLFNKYIKKRSIKIGSIIKGKVYNIGNENVIIDAGLKSESYISINEFRNSNGDIEVKNGDLIDVILESIEDGYGVTILSREKAKKYNSWLFLEKAKKNNIIIKGIINGKVKGGFTVDINGIQAFLPGSLIDIKPFKDSSFLEGMHLSLKVVKIDKRRNNIVVSRKSVIEYNKRIKKKKSLSKISEGKEIVGIIKNITEYGAFIDLGSVDGLLHITDISWKRINHPNDILNPGEYIKLKILKFDKINLKMSLGLKQLISDPWKKIDEKYPKRTKTLGKVTNITEYGCFIEIEDGIEGLVHNSEIDWVNKNVNISKILKLNDKVEVMILNIDHPCKRISLGIKQCKINPWYKFSKKYKFGDKVKGYIKSITSFGIFVSLEDKLDGLIHISDISWKTKNLEIFKKYKKGNKILSVLLNVNIKKERISLGIKQLKNNPIIMYMSLNKKNKIVKGKIIRIDNIGILLELKKNVNSYIKRSLITNKKFYEENIYYKNILKLRLLGIDYKNQMIRTYIIEK